MFAFQAKRRLLAAPKHAKNAVRAAVVRGWMPASASLGTGVSVSVFNDKGVKESSSSIANCGSRYYSGSSIPISTLLRSRQQQQQQQHEVKLTPVFKEYSIKGGGTGNSCVVSADVRPTYLHF